MDYIKEELNHPLGRPENCGQIYWRAMKMLQGESAEVFVAKHAMHQAGHVWKEEEHLCEIVLYLLWADLY